MKIYLTLIIYIIILFNTLLNRTIGHGISGGTPALEINPEISTFSFLIDDRLTFKGSLDLSVPKELFYQTLSYTDFVVKDKPLAVNNFKIVGDYLENLTHQKNDIIQFPVFRDDDHEFIMSRAMVIRQYLINLFYARMRENDTSWKLLQTSSNYENLTERINIATEAALNLARSQGRPVSMQDLVEVDRLIKILRRVNYYLDLQHAVAHAYADLATTLIFKHDEIVYWAVRKESMRFDDFNENMVQYFKMKSIANESDYKHWLKYMAKGNSVDTNASLAPFRSEFYKVSTSNGKTTSENLSLLMKIMSEFGDDMLTEMMNQDSPELNYVKWNRQLKELLMIH